MKQIVTMLVLMGICFQLHAMQVYKTIDTVDRSFTDHIPFDIAYVPSLFSVRHQMAKYGIEKQDGTGYEFAQLSASVHKEVLDVLQELNFDYSATYILKLHPQLSTKATSVIVTNACIFIDEQEWLRLSDPDLHFKFAQLVEEKGWDVTDPVRAIKKYILKRAIAHYKNGTYRIKVASSLVVGAALAVAVHKASSSVHEFVAEKNADLGVTDTLSSAMPTLASVCSACYVPALFKFVAQAVVSSIIGDQLRGLAHGAVTGPLWKHLDKKAEQDTIASEQQDTKKLLVSYNKTQADWKKSNMLIGKEYAWRADLIAHALNKQ